MTQITLRGIDPAVERKIRMMARSSGKSLNSVVLDILYQHAEFRKERQRSPVQTLRQLAGGWTEEDAREFFVSIKLCEQVHEEIWT